MICEVCEDLGTYPIIDAKGTHRYDITCPECFGINEEKRRYYDQKCAEDSVLLERIMREQNHA